MIRQIKERISLASIRAVFLALLVVSVSIALFTACFPTWSPDSSSIVFNNRRGDLIIRDLKTKKNKVLLKGRGNRGSYPSVAIRPDGKRVAQVIQFSEGRSSIFLSLTIRNLAGKSTHQLKKFRLGDEIFSFTSGGAIPLVDWSPDGKKVLVQTLMCEQSLLFDTESGKPIRIPASIPAKYVFQPYSSASPISPDSKTFIAATTKKERLTFALFSLESGKKLFDFDASAIKPQQKYFLLSKPVEMHVSLSGYWKGKRRVVPRNDGLFIFDCEKKTIEFKNDMRMQVLTDLAKKHKVHVIAELSKNVVLCMGGLLPDRERQVAKMMIYNFRTEKLVELKEVQAKNLVRVVRSPDKKKTLVSSVFVEDETISVVLDDQGKVIDELRFGE